MPKTKGKLYVIDGTDGSGKKTQVDLLMKKLQERGYKTKYVDFPQYDKISASLVQAYLNGEFGTADEVKPEVASIFFAIDRWSVSQEMKQALEQGTIILANRYVSSNKGHQAGKIKDKKKLEKFLKWLDELEYEIFAIPRPDQVILLHVPCEVGQKLVDKKGFRNYIGGHKRDIHEKDIKHLKDAEKSYLSVAKRDNWKIIGCVDAENKLMSIEDINSKLLDFILADINSSKLKVQNAKIKMSSPTPIGDHNAKPTS